jgi:hypothetical protein
MGDEPFDILSINESRLDANIARDTVRIQGYDMVANMVLNFITEALSLLLPRGSRSSLPRNNKA